LISTAIENTNTMDDTHNTQPPSVPQPLVAAVQETKYCTECGKVIFRKAEICPNCGCRQSPSPRQANFNLPNLSVPPTTGRLIILVVGNILWNGLGNLVIGDNRGWTYGFINLACFIASLFTLGIPCIVWCLYCSAKGYEYLKEVENKATQSYGTSGPANRAGDSALPTWRL
jgi:hypothetical protein